MGSTVAKKQDVNFAGIVESNPQVAGDIAAIRADAVYGIVKEDDGQRIAKCVIRQSPTDPDCYKIDVVNSLPMPSAVFTTRYAPLADGLDVLVPQNAAEEKQLKQLYVDAVAAKLEEQTAWRAANYKLSAVNDEGCRAYYGELFQIKNFDTIYAVGDSSVFIDYAGGEQITFEDSSNIEKGSPESWYTFLQSKKQLGMSRLESVTSPATGRTEVALYSDKYQALFELTPAGHPSVKFKYQIRNHGSEDGSSSGGGASSSGSSSSGSSSGGCRGGGNS